MRFEQVDRSRTELFRGASDAEWNDWHWQMSHQIRDIETLAKVINLTEDEETNLAKVLEKFEMRITPYYAALMDKDDPSDPVRQLSVPTFSELYDDPSDLEDPLHEDIDSPAPGLTHRYPDRVLLLVTNICSMNCRHCTRRRLVDDEDTHMTPDGIQAAIDYIAAHEEIRDVLISGGDPLTLTDQRLESIIARVRAIEHVEIIRIGTRMPVVMPQRITDDLVAMLRKYHPLYVNTHFNHAREITQEAADACAKLADAGISLGNQTVLLRGLNDDPVVMKKLMHMLLTIRVKPYYIYQCDLSLGISHFRTSVMKGMEIIESLRGHTTGFAVPTFVVDAPGGGGKIPVMPNYLISMSDDRAVLRNFEGVITTYTWPSVQMDVTSRQAQREPGDALRFRASGGVAGLLQGDVLSLEPTQLARNDRQVGGDSDASSMDARSRGAHRQLPISPLLTGRDA